MACVLVQSPYPPKKPKKNPKKQNSIYYVYIEFNKMAESHEQSMLQNKVEQYKIIHIVVPKEAEDFNDTFTPEDNYEMIKIGRQKILDRKKTTPPPHKNEKKKTAEKIKELEKQIEWMRVELVKYGILCDTP